LASVVGDRVIAGLKFEAPGSLALITNRPRPPRFRVQVRIRL